MDRCGAFAARAPKSDRLLAKQPHPKQPMTPDLTLRQQSEYGLHLPGAAQPVQAFLLVATYCSIAAPDHVCQGMVCQTATTEAIGIFLIATNQRTKSDEAYLGKKLSQYTSNRLSNALMANAIFHSAAGSR